MSEVIILKIKSSRIGIPNKSDKKEVNKNG